MNQSRGKIFVILSLLALLTGAAAARDWTVMKVPGRWEGLGGEFKNLDGYVWYRIFIQIPGKWKGQNLIIATGGCDDRGEVFFNGEKIGGAGRNNTIKSSLVRFGRFNLVAVRVRDTGGGGGMTGKPVIRCSKGRMSLVGNWQIKPGEDLSLGKWPCDPNSSEARKIARDFEENVFSPKAGAVQLHPRHQAMVSASRKLTDRQIDEFIKGAVAFLLSRNQDDGRFGSAAGSDPDHFFDGKFEVPKDSGKWKDSRIKARIAGTIRGLKPEPFKQSVYTTALAARALLTAGVDFKDPKIRKAIKFLMTHDTMGVRGISARCSLWLTAGAASGSPRRYTRFLRHDMTRLAWSRNLPAGGWDETVWRGRAKNPVSTLASNASRSYFLSGGDCNKIAPNYWINLLKYWTDGQLNCGGWSRDPKTRKHETHNMRLSMTAAALADMYACIDAINPPAYLKAGEGKLPGAIIKAQSCMDQYFLKCMAENNKPKRCEDGRFGLLAWNLARAGNSSGRSRFGYRGHWFRICASELVKQAEDGILGESVVQTSYALLFLVKGRRPVAFNKLDFGGDSSSRPRDAAHVAQWMNLSTSWKSNWQAASIEDPVSSWLEAPILYITGSGAPAITDENLKKLRRYALLGGTIFTAAGERGKPFSDWARLFCMKAFPKYKLAPVPIDHPLYSSPYNLRSEKTIFPLHVLTNGSRPLLIHTDADISRTWQDNRLPASVRAFRLAVNIVAYVSGGYGQLKRRPRRYSAPKPGSEAARRVRLVRIKYKGNYNPEPLAWEIMGNKLNRNEDIDVSARFAPLERLGEADEKMAVMTGTGPAALTGAGKKALKDFVTKGGTLLVDAAGGDREFHDSIKPVLEELFGPASPVGPDSPVMNRKETPIKKIAYRPAAMDRFKAEKLDADKLYLQVIKVGDREAVYLSREDLTNALLGFPGGPVDGYNPWTAYRIVRNIMMNPEFMKEPVAPAQLPGTATGPGDLPARIPEAREYALVYDMDLAKLARDIRYDVDNSSKRKESFDRVAYLLELRKSDGRDQYVFVSFRAMTDDAAKIGIPTKKSGARFQQPVDSMNVYSNVSGVKTGKGMKGYIEFWPDNYGGKNNKRVRNASDNYDWGDQITRPEDGYGSMQVHNPGARHVIFAINQWKAKNQADLGIGNSTGKNRDWTFTKTAGSYSKKRLRVFVRPKR